MKFERKTAGNLWYVPSFISFQSSKVNHEAMKPIYGGCHYQVQELLAACEGWGDVLREVEATQQLHNEQLGAGAQWLKLSDSL